MKYDLSIVIPARNEQFVTRTVQDIVEKRMGNTEVIVVLDGAWAEPPIPQTAHVNVVCLPESIGQRAATNLGARISQGEWIMKLDAHCAFDQAFDLEMLKVAKNPNNTYVPVMKNLHAFDWVCEKCGFTSYQGPQPDSCNECGHPHHRMKIVWRGKSSPNSTSYRFTRELEFKYFPEYKSQQEGDLVMTMSLQGSCFMVHRDRYFDHKLCDESYGSWGGQGAEVALKTWLAGGKVLVNKKTWYAHMFRTQKDFSFPYPNPAKEQRQAKNKLREVFLNDQWEHAVYKLEQLVEKFKPVPDWHDTPNQTPQTVSNGLTGQKGILYYTDSRLPDRYGLPVITQLNKIGLPLVSSSLKPLDFGHNLCFALEPGYMTMFQQILEGLQRLKTKYVFFAEHDVLYHPTHFEFTPPQDDVFYYNENVWKIHAEFGFGLHYRARQTSGLCANRELLVKHYEKRIGYLTTHGSLEQNDQEFRRLIRRVGFEPGTHGRIPELKGKADGWLSPYPNLDIRHNENLTPSRWRKDQFRNKKFCQGWFMSEAVPGWGKLLGRFDEVLQEVQNGTNMAQ